MGTLYDVLESYTPSMGKPASFFCYTMGKNHDTSFDDKDFQKSFSFVVDNIGIPAVNVADYLLVSKPTVLRWKEGKNLPHNPMRRPVLLGLVGLIDSWKFVPRND